MDLVNGPLKDSIAAAAALLLLQSAVPASFAAAGAPSTQASKTAAAQATVDEDDEDAPKPLPPPPVFVRYYSFAKKSNGGTSVISTAFPLSSRTPKPSTTAEITSSKSDPESLKEKGESKEVTSETNNKGEAQVVSTRPVSPAVIPYIVKAYDDMRKGSFDGAIPLLCKAVKIDKDCVTARRYLAYCLLKTGSSSEAIAQLLFLSRMTKPSVFDKYSLAEASVAIGNYKQAIEAYRDALAMDPNNDPARGGLIKVLASDGKYDEAFLASQEGLRRTAQNPKLQKYYKDLLELVAQEKTAPEAQVPSYTTSTETNNGQYAEPSSNVAPVRWHQIPINPAESIDRNKTPQSGGGG